MHNLLSILIFLPLAFGIVTLFLRDSGSIRACAMAGTVATLVVSAIIWWCYHFATVPGGPVYPISETADWIPRLHIKYMLGLDGISLLMVLMTAVIWPFIVGVSFREIHERENQFYFWTLLLETAVLGVFLSLDLILFYVFWEAMLIPLYFIIGIWGGPRRVYATVKFFLYTMVGSMVMLVSILAMYFLGGQHSFDLPALQNSLPAVFASNHGLEMLLFIGFFLAFAIKAPMFPFHTWVPDAYQQAPTGGTIMLVALKMGLYGFIRFCIPLFPHAVQESAPLITILSVVGVVWAAWVAAMQPDLKRLLAYSSISHVGVIMLAIFALNYVGISGALIQMVSHTITMGALFILVGGLYARRKSFLIADFGGLTKVMPAFTVIFLIAVLSSVALPTTAGFTGEILMLMGAFQHFPWQTGVAATAAIWSVVYMLWMFQRVMYGKIDKPENENLPDCLPSERWALVPLVVLIFAIGVYPTPILDPVNASVQTVMGASPVLDVVQAGPPLSVASLPKALVGRVAVKGDRQ
ncbi:MAG: complex I subunit 4 family protein [Capsulimonadaceae bacterium]